MSEFTPYTKEELQAQLAELKKAYAAAATGKSYTIDGQTVTRQSLVDLRAAISDVSNQLAAMEPKRRPATVFVRPRFVR